MCPIKTCYTVLSAKNVCRHFKGSHPLTYESASQKLNYKKKYVPIRKYFSAMKDCDEKEASKRVYTYGQHVDQEQHLEKMNEAEEDVTEQLESEYVEKETVHVVLDHDDTVTSCDKGGADVEDCPLHVNNEEDGSSDPICADKVESMALIKNLSHEDISQAGSSTQGSCNDMPRIDKEYVLEITPERKLKRDSFVASKVTTPSFKHRLLLADTPEGLKQSLANFGESLLKMNLNKKSVSQKLNYTERVMVYLLDLTGSKWNELPYDSEIAGKVYEVLEKMPSERRGAEKGEKLKTGARTIAVNSLAEYYAFVAKTDPDALVIHQTIEVLCATHRKRWSKSGKGEIMQALRRDKDNLINLEDFAKHLLEGNEISDMVNILEEHICDEKVLHPSQRVKIRNRIFTDLLLLNPARPGEACSLTVGDVFAAKDVKNKGKGSVLFITYSVEEPESPDTVVRDFAYHKTYLSHGTKYLFALPGLHKLIKTFITYMNSRQDDDVSPDTFILLNDKGKTPMASSWTKAYFPGEFKA